MKVRLNTTISGTRNGVNWPSKGEVVDLPDAEAVDLLHAGSASPVVEEKTVELASLDTNTAARKRK